VHRIQQGGVRVALATNPVFPAVATRARVSWTGLSFGDFEFVTTYENSRHCKPNLGYFKDVLELSGLEARDCLMVGNDTSDDLPASRLGMDVFILTDCLINKDNVDLTDIPHGSFEDLQAFLGLGRAQ